MDNSNNGNRRIHPLMAVAAGAVILASGVGVAAMTGLLPSAHSNDAPLQASQPIAAALPAPAATPSAAQLERDRDLARRREHERELERQRLAEHHHDHDGDRYQQPGYAQQPAYVAPAQRVDPNAGVVEAITPVAERTSQDTGLGAVGGAVAGGLLGHQVGRGNGRIAATVIGALGGGVAGNAIESNIHTQTDYQVSLRMDDGSSRTITLHNQPQVGVGQHVRLDSNGMYAI